MILLKKKDDRVLFLIIMKIEKKTKNFRFFKKTASVLQIRQ